MKLLQPLMDALRAAGVQTKILHFPDAYELDGQGREPWAGYVDKLVEEIDKAAGSSSRPLLLFGHSRGAAPAITVATRLGARVRKVYIAACGAMEQGKATGWELLSHRFKEGGDRDLIKWFSSIQPDNILLNRLAYEASDTEFQSQITSSKFFGDMLQLMRVQYRDAMYPDPDRDFNIISAPIMAFSPLLDEGSQPEHLAGWGLLTSGSFQLERVMAGHMDCLMPAPTDTENIEVDVDLTTMCPFIPVTDQFIEVVKNMAKIQARQAAKEKAGRCMLADGICQDVQQFLA